MGLFNFDSIIDNLKGYVETQVSLTKIEIKEEVQQSIAKLVSMLLLSVFLFFFLLFLSAALALYLNEILNSPYLGFVLITVFYLILCLLGAWFIKTEKFKSLIQKFIR
ncbi:phage holin family protein [Cytophagales bacterium LB-30]|uniref:Phage holin family protein n=1 Tax=Shiella aurantiaca TaxID=3058365 RepID=A0ABT8F5R4_9BACT|nr:phage holin family protein [Shiella aurantiaca]MDN4165728.1 phage holin family protein [Shiella aurantiaca]